VYKCTVVVFCVVVAPCRLVCGYLNCGGTYCFHLQDRSGRYVTELSHWPAIIDSQVSRYPEDQTKHFEVKLRPGFLPSYLDVGRMSRRVS
jgi:hypothetical protein